MIADNQGLARIAYAADLGGNVYRITIGNAAPGSWSMTKIASLGCDTVSTCTPNRKFMFGPDVVEDNNVFVVLVGSGRCWCLPSIGPKWKCSNRDLAS